MIAARAGELRVYRFALLDQVPDLVQAVSTRLGGHRGDLNLSFRVGDDAARVHENRARLLAALGLDSFPTASLRQVHGDGVHVVRREEAAGLAAGPTAALPPGDALVTADAGLTLMVYCADCVPVLLCDPQAGVIGAVHASWRSTVVNIVGHAVAQMQALGARAERIRAGLGPSIGPCCFEVGQDVVQAADLRLAEARRFFHRADGRLTFDLWSANAALLGAAGLRSSHIEVAGLCTACHTDIFFSHRAEGGKTGRQVGLICRRPAYPDKSG